MSLFRKVNIFRCFERSIYSVNKCLLNPVMSSIARGGSDSECRFVVEYSMFPKSKVFAHRGLHSPETPANSIAALVDALERGFSIETDIRDSYGQIVIEHDPRELLLSEQLRLSNLLEIKRDNNQTLALNVKSDGLLAIRPNENFGNHFYFDMSGPETLRYMKASVPIAMRVSEHENEVSAISRGIANWVWLDSFEDDWFLRHYADVGFLLRPTVVVSPELHGRKPEAAWNWVASKYLEGNDVSICTDLPNEFLAHLNEAGL